MNNKFESVPEVPCGNLVAIVGVDQYLQKQGTLATDENAFSIKPMKFSVSPVVRVAVSVKKPMELPKLVEGLRKLALSDPLVQCSTDPETNESIVAGCGELHVEICIKDLVENYAKCELVIGQPVVQYLETIRGESIQMAKSANKHNRLYVKAEPLDPQLVEMIENKKLGPNTDPKERTRILVE